MADFAPIAGGHGANSDGTNAVTGSFDSTGAAFGALVVIYTKAGGALSVTDGVSGSNVWSLVKVSDNGNDRVAIYSCPIAVTNASHTVAVATSSGFPAVMVEVYSVTAGKSVVADQTNGGTASASTTCATGSVTPTQDNSLIVAGCLGTGSSNAFSSIDSSFTSRQASAGDGNNWAGDLADFIQTTAGAKGPTFTFGSSGTMAAAIATFYARAATAGRMFAAF